MTPLHIEILLHYNRFGGRPLDASSDEYRCGDFTAPAVGEYLADLESAGLLLTQYKPSQPASGRFGFCITERGLFYVRALCQVPPPKERTSFVIEWPKGETL